MDVIFVGSSVFSCEVNCIICGNQNVWLLVPRYSTGTPVYRYCRESAKVRTNKKKEIDGPFHMRRPQGLNAVPGTEKVPVPVFLRTRNSTSLAARRRLQEVSRRLHYNQYMTLSCVSGLLSHSHTGTQIQYSAFPMALSEEANIYWKNKH